MHALSLYLLCLLMESTTSAEAKLKELEKQLAEQEEKVDAEKILSDELAKQVEGWKAKRAEKVLTPRLFAVVAILLHFVSFSTFYSLRSSILPHLPTSRSFLWLLSCVSILLFSIPFSFPSSSIPFHSRLCPIALPLVVARLTQDFFIVRLHKRQYWISGKRRLTGSWRGQRPKL